MSSDLITFRFLDPSEFMPMFHPDSGWSCVAAMPCGDDARVSAWAYLKKPGSPLRVVEDIEDLSHDEAKVRCRVVEGNLDFPDVLRAMIHIGFGGTERQEGDPVPFYEPDNTYFQFAPLSVVLPNTEF